MKTLDRLASLRGVAGRLPNGLRILRHSIAVAVGHVIHGHLPNERNPLDRSCIRCTGPLEERVVERCDAAEGVVEEIRRGVCEVCSWTDWDPPVPVVSALMPFPKRYIGATDVEGPFHFNPDDYSTPSQTGIALIRRGNDPFRGELALPGGYIMRGETPRESLCGEVLQETGIKGEVECFLHPCNPLPGRLNQVILHGLVRPVDGKLAAGDDAQEVMIVGASELPKLCFSSHQKTAGDYTDGKNGFITGKRQYP